MNIVIAGASRGIGYELIKILSKKHRVLALSRNIASLKKLNDRSGKFEILQFDLRDKNNHRSLLPVLQKNFYPVDILINNAGTLLKKPFKTWSAEDMNATFDTNFFGIARLIQSIYPYMNAAPHPHIVNIGSMGGFQGSAKFPGLSIYSASKAALACLSECLAEEFKDEKIAVNCLAIGAVQTEMLAEAFPGYKAPLSAKQMAEFIADFSLSGHQYFNGKVLPVSVSTP